jgi:hypothetical protein
VKRLASAVAVCALFLLALAPLRSAHAADPKKPRLDYDARKDPPPSAEDVGLWVPRVVLFPVWLVHEYGVRKPIGAIVKAKPEGVEGAPDSLPSIAPSLLLDLGFRPWVGIYASWKPSWAHDHELLGYVAFGGLGAMTESLADRIKTPYGTVGLREEWTRRDDGLFHGLGPTTTKQDARRYGYERFDGALSFDMPIRDASAHLLAMGGLRGLGYHAAGCCEDDAPLQRATTPGGARYTAIYERAVLGVDTRPAIPGRSFGEPPRRSGIRAAVEGEVAVDIEHRARSWTRYGAVVSGYWDIHHQRVLSLTLNAHFVDALNGSTNGVPFPEQAVLGGDAPMQGFRAGRLTGQSASAATLAYEWPIWLWLAGVIDASVGNTFGTHLRDFDPELLRMSSTIGAHVLASNDHYFQMLAGFGTQPLGNGFKPESFRLTFGMTSRF